jgi:hypothetical protein
LFIMLSCAPGSLCSTLLESGAMESSVRNRLRLLMVLSLVLIVLNVLATLSGVYQPPAAVSAAGNHLHQESTE